MTEIIQIAKDENPEPTIERCRELAESMLQPRRIDHMDHEREAIGVLEIIDADSNRQIAATLVLRGEGDVERPRAPLPR